MTPLPEPAFPQPNQLHPQNSAPESGAGMTMRDYFAAKALSGLLAHPSSDSHGDSELTKQAYNLADAMLEARK